MQSALGLVLILATTAMAQTSAPERKAPLALDPLVVTATVAPTPLSQTTASVTVITREEIVARQAGSVTDLLRQVPGVHIDQAGGRGSISSVYLRGSDPNFTVVLIDGVKVNDPTNSRGGSYDFSTLGTENIERLEIVHGPLSAVYGSDALGGVINIITRQGEPEPARSIEGAGGRFGYVRTVLQARGMLGEMDYALSGAYVDNGEPVTGSGFRNTALNANLGMPLGKTMEIRWAWRYADSDSEAFPDDSGGPGFAVRREVEERDTQELTLGMTLTHEPFPWWEYRLQLGIVNRQELIDSPGVAPGVRNPFGIPPNLTDNTLWRYDVTLRHLFTVHRGVRVGLGAQAQFEKGSSTGNLDLGGFLLPTSFTLSRDSWAPFLEVQISPLAGLLLRGGVRLDLPEGFDAEVSPRVGVSYTITATGTTLRASWGEGFKLPSFFALGHSIVGNPTLVPETSRSVEAGVTQALWGKRVTVGVAYFTNTFTNLIDFDEAQNRLVNRSEVTTEGVDTSLRVRPWSRLEVTAHLAYVKTDIKGTEEELRNRPTWRGGFTVQWFPLSTLQTSLQALWVGETQDSSIPTGDRPLDAYARVDLAVTWTVAAHWQLLLAVDNLFDADYQEFVGFPAPGITPRAGVRFRF